MRLLAVKLSGTNLGSEMFGEVDLGKLALHYRQQCHRHMAHIWKARVTRSGTVREVWVVHHREIVEGDLVIRLPCPIVNGP